MSGVEPVAALTTKRLQLRSPVASDATAITAILNDFEISKWLSVVPFPYTRADALEFIADVREKGSAIWAWTDRSPPASGFRHAFPNAAPRARACA